MLESNEIDYFAMGFLLNDNESHVIYLGTLVTAITNALSIIRDVYTDGQGQPLTA